MWHAGVWGEREVRSGTGHWGDAGCCLHPVGAMQGLELRREAQCFITVVKSTSHKIYHFKDF